jgi:hypothetical protein
MTKKKFQKRHFHDVAKILRTNLFNYKYDKNKDVDDIEIDGACYTLVKDLAVDFHNIFRLDNPDYDANKFFTACGIDDWQDMTRVEDYDLRPYRGRA